MKQFNKIKIVSIIGFALNSFLLFNILFTESLLDIVLRTLIGYWVISNVIFLGCFFNVLYFNDSLIKGGRAFLEKDFERSGSNFNIVYSYRPKDRLYFDLVLYSKLQTQEFSEICDILESSLKYDYFPEAKREEIKILIERSLEQEEEEFSSKVRRISLEIVHNYDLLKQQLVEQVNLTDKHVKQERTKRKIFKLSYIVLLISFAIYFILCLLFFPELFYDVLFRNFFLWFLINFVSIFFIGFFGMLLILVFLDMFGNLFYKIKKS